MKKMKKGTKEYYSKGMEKTGHSKTAIPDWTDQRCYSQKEMGEDKFSKLSSAMDKPKKKGY